VIEHNEISRTPLDGIRVGAYIPDQPTRDNLVTRNVVTGAGNDGISMAATEGPVGVTTVTLNAVTGADGDGIHVGSLAVSGAVTLAGNRTVRNGQYGIEAVVAVRDGGGNVASGNRAGAQCTGVLCRPAA